MSQANLPNWIDQNLYGVRQVNQGGAGLPARPTINFNGQGVTATDNPITNSTDVVVGPVDIPGSQTLWEPALAAAFTNFDLDSIVGAIDGVTIPAAGRFALFGQSIKSSNGLYFKDVTGFATRTTDADASNDFVSGKGVFVQGGSGKGKTFVLVTLGTITLESTDLRFIQQGTTVDARVLAASDGSTDDLANLQGAFLAAPDVVLSAGIGAYKIGSSGTLGGAGKVLRPARGAIVHIPNGVALNIGASNIEAGADQQVFQIDAGGSLAWKPVAGEIHAAWLGVKGDAIAVTGAGTDSTLALQTALNAAGQLQSGAGVVRLPGGQVRFTSTLNIPGGVALVGQGNGGLGTWTSLNYEGANDTNAIEIKATPNTAGGTRVEDLFVCRTAGQGGDAIFVDCVASGGHQVSNLIVRNVSTFSGNPTLGGATAIAAGSNGASLPQATIHIASETTFVGLNKALVITGDGPQVVSFTGTGAGTLTGCTGGTGLMTTGNTVTAPFNFGRGLHFDGSAFDTVGHRGVRNTLVEKFRCGDCFTRLEFIRLSQVTHFVGLGIQVDTGGTGLADTSTGITIDKGTGTESANVMISGLICNGSLVLGDACRNVKIQGYVSGDLDLASTVTRCDLQLNVDGSVAIDLSATGTWVGTWAGLGGTAFVDYTDGTFNLDVAGYGRRNGKHFEPVVPSFTTTDGTTGVICTLYIPDNCDVIVDADVAAYQATTGDGMGATQKLTIKRHGGGAALLGTGTLVNPTPQHDAGAAAWSILWGVSGNNAILQVTGENAKTIKWSASVRATYLGAMNP